MPFGFRAVARRRRKLGRNDALEGHLIAVLVSHEQLASRADKILRKVVDELVKFAAGGHRPDSSTWVLFGTGLRDAESHLALES